MDNILIKLVMIGVAVALYALIYRALRSRRKDSRVAGFSVGGRKRREKDAAEMDRAERISKRKVSLRGGSMFRRRF